MVKVEGVRLCGQVLPSVLWGMCRKAKYLKLQPYFHPNTPLKPEQHITPLQKHMQTYVPGLHQLSLATSHCRNRTCADD